MSDTEFNVTFAGPLVTVQDAGRPGHMRFGVPHSGPMDRLAFHAAHAALGNALGLGALEVSLGGLVLTCTQGAVTLSITGGDFVVDHAGQTYRSWVILTVKKDERLSLRAGPSGSWAYVAFAGQLHTQSWLGSSATHALSGFGGGAVTTGQVLGVKQSEIRDDRLGDIPQIQGVDTGPMRVVMGPQDQHFDAAALDHFTRAPFKVTDAYDRMGMRLNGPALALKAALSIPSEPIVRGSVQVAGDGVPTVLLADHQTTGGYPKIATVVGCDTDRLAQHRKGQEMRFKSICAQDAVRVARDHSARMAEYLDQIAVARGSFAQRLMRENLIFGCDWD
ncbi:biotin-dependent carboxyltransferase family protein [Ascidiaceihabitans sp.]|uniref:5-oxoprolinase subunit C family protein n=1 Tax=Ascidiaceihabitans sp. TaxID=1872644 RepID=UPI003296DAED